VIGQRSGETMADHIVDARVVDQEQVAFGGSELERDVLDQLPHGCIEILGVGDLVRHPAKQLEAAGALPIGEGFGAGHGYRH